MDRSAPYLFSFLDRMVVMIVVFVVLAVLVDRRRDSAQVAEHGDVRGSIHDLHQPGGRLRHDFVVAEITLPAHA